MEGYVAFRTSIQNMGGYYMGILLTAQFMVQDFIQKVSDIKMM